jgi:hypothetical protein
MDKYLKYIFILAFIVGIFYLSYAQRHLYLPDYCKDNPTAQAWAKQAGPEQAILAYQTFCRNDFFSKRSNHIFKEMQGEDLGNGLWQVTGIKTYKKNMNEWQEPFRFSMNVEYLGNGKWKWIAY